jgi:starch synthase (maltosyl-transferring)
MLCWSKQRGEDVVLVVVNLDPHGAREATVHLDLAALGLGSDDVVQMSDVVTGAVYEWGAHNYVWLDPFTEPAHVFSLSAVRP